MYRRLFSESVNMASPKSVFKIYNPKTDQYSRGGTFPRWGRSGKVWNGSGPLRSHLNLVYEYAGKGCYNDPYVDCEIVEFVVRPEECARISVKEFRN